MPSKVINVDEPYDKAHHATRYSFIQCPNAEFAKKHRLLHVLPLLCNSDFFGISEVHGYWVGHTRVWDIPGTEDLKPYISTTRSHRDR